MNWLELLEVQGTLKSLLQHHSSKASILRHSAFFTVQLSHPYMTTGKIIALTRQSTTWRPYYRTYFVLPSFWFFFFFPFLFLNSKITADGDFSHEIQMLAPWKKSYDQSRKHVKKQRHCFINKGLASQSCVFSSGHVWM